MECQEVISETPDSEVKRTCLRNNNMPILSCTEFNKLHDFQNFCFSVNSVITRLLFYFEYVKSMARDTNQNEPCLNRAVYSPRQLDTYVDIFVSMSLYVCK